MNFLSKTSAQNFCYIFSFHHLNNLKVFPRNLLYLQLILSSCFSIQVACSLVYTNFNLRCVEQKTFILCLLKYLQFFLNSFILQDSFCVRCWYVCDCRRIRCLNEYESRKLCYYIDGISTYAVANIVIQHSFIKAILLQKLYCSPMPCCFSEFHALSTRFSTHLLNY